MGSFGRNFLKLALPLGCAFPLFTGCGLLFYLKEDLAHKEMRNQGYELCHIDSCGPEALGRIFQSFGILKDRTQISKEIQDGDHIHYRTILGAFNHKFHRITCPPELLNYCRSQELIVTKVPYDSLTSSDVAIILMRGRSHIDDWHWMEWPNKTEVVETFFGADTKIVSTYLLVKK
jgi:hypothetical protein